jgi:uncharacterized protein YecE (DUF72 family)
MHVRIGTAGWSIASRYVSEFPAEGMALERYAHRLSCVEINSSFYRSHRPDTWTRWGAMVPADFRFAVKIPRSITHERRLRGCGDLIARLLDETAGLGDKLAVLLVQLPPTLDYRPEVAEDFLTELSATTRAHIVCEPRHPSWFAPAPDAHLAQLRVARVAADPGPVPGAGDPGGWRGFAYWRLHGSPDIYHSPYDFHRIDLYAERITGNGSKAAPPWCIFDNTASFAALGNALELNDRLNRNQNSDRSLVDGPPDTAKIRDS